MEYTVVNDFIDKDNDGLIYYKGDKYPKGKYKPTKKRIEELSKQHPKYGIVFIESSEKE